MVQRNAPAVRDQPIDKLQFARIGRERAVALVEDHAIAFGQR